MKNLIKISVSNLLPPIANGIAICILQLNLAFAQSPQSFSYQSVVRDGSGNVVVNQPVSFQISLISGSATGTVMYVETHAATTNSFGLVSLAIGEGTLVSGSFAGIAWANDLHFIKVEVDITGGTAYVDMGTVQLLSVPYALNSKTSEDAFSGNYSDLNGVPTDVSTFNNDAGYITNPNDADADPMNEIQDLSISGNDLTISGANTVTIPQNTYTAGNGIDVTANVITNTLPDQIIAITGSGATTVTGTYPSFTIASTDNVNDADADPTNELQILSVSNDTLYLTNGGFVSLSGYADTLWRLVGSNIYNTNSGKVGIGTNTPPGKLVVQGDPGMADTVPLFEVKDRTGATVFIVYPDSARFYVCDDNSKTNKGAFAVSGRNTVKQPTNDFLLVTPDSSRIWTKDTLMGFGVRNINGANKTSYMQLTPNNYFIGHLSGEKITPAGLYNSIFGYQAGKELTTGSSNSIVGYKAGQNITWGTQNVLLGNETGLATTTGSYNTALGSFALHSNIIGGYNVAVGYQAMLNNLSGTYNTSIGSYTLYNNTIGGYNTVIGYGAMYMNVDGQENTALGAWVLQSNVTGTYNTAAGSESMNYNVSGHSNSAFGRTALYSNVSGSRNTAIGSSSMYSNNAGNDNTAIGHYSMQSNTDGYENIAVGTYTMNFNTLGHNNIAVGKSALSSNTTGNWNIAIGTSALGWNSSGEYNTAVGNNALSVNTTGYNNVVVGYNAMMQNDSGYANAAFGDYALFENKNGYNNTAIGYMSMYHDTTGFRNTTTGCQSLFWNTGSGNCAFGYFAMFSSSTGANNSAFGYNAMTGNSTGTQNTAYGYSSLTANNTGNYNTAIGASAGTFGDLTNTTALGYSAQTNADNQVRVGNSSVTSIGGFADWTNISDKRFKKDISENVHGIDFIIKLKPVTYYLDMNKIAEFLHTPDSLRLRDAEKIKGSMLQTGFIAQDVEKAALELGFDFSGVDKPKTKDDFYGLRYAEFTVPLVKAVQELNEKDKQLNEKDKQLLEENKQLRIIIDQLSQRIEKLEKK